ncbi:MAG: potassium-transporting ATPase subunit KdpA, partial [Acidimicrobiales bacterium]
MGLALTLLALVVTLAITWRLLGSYMAAIFDGRLHFLSAIERPVYRLLGTDPSHEQSWKRYAGALVVFSAVSLTITYAVLRLQGHLPLNP